MEQKTKILLIGKAGQGKSSLGNFLLNEARFQVSDIPNKMLRSINKSERNGLTIIDTCGLGYENDTNNFKEIIQCISNDYINEILIVMNAQENRITYETEKMIKLICNNFNYRIIQHYISFVFTNFYGEYKQKEKLISSKKIFIKEIEELINKFCGKKENIYIEYFFVDSDLDNPDRDSLFIREKILNRAKSMRQFNIKE